VTAGQANATGAGTVVVTATVTGGGATAALDFEQDFTITFSAAPTAPTITTTTLPSGTVGTAYSQTLAATGTTPITWSVSGGSLPAGLSLSSAGVISGTPTASGTFNFTVMATNIASNDTQALSIVINAAAVTTHTITASAGSGGSISPSGSVSVNNGANQTFTITPNSGFAITNVTVNGSNIGAVSSHTFTNVTANHTIHATFHSTATGGNNQGGGTTTGGSDRDSDRNGGGGGGIRSAITSLFTPRVSQEMWKTAQMAASLMQGAVANDQNFTRSNHDYRFGVRAAAWDNLDGMRFDHDTTDARGVQVRVTIQNPGEISQDKLVSAWVSGNDVSSVRGIFERHFSNNLQVVHFDHSGEWGQSVRAAARVDLTGKDTDNLYFYNFDREANTFRLIAEPNDRVDSNGFLWFNVDRGGAVVVSDGPLARR